jgi:hypothetical protein
LPSGEKATENSGCARPGVCQSSFPVAVSHKLMKDLFFPAFFSPFFAPLLTTHSFVARANVRPSGENIPA